MSKLTLRLSTDRRAGLNWPCHHCGSERILAPLSVLIGFNRKRPLPGLDDALQLLAKHAGYEATAAICPGCICITTDIHGC